MIDIKMADPSAKLNKAFQNAKKTGKLVLSNLGLNSFPEAIHSFNDVSVEGDKWWEDTPLTLLDLSHNKIE